MKTELSLQSKLTFGKYEGQTVEEVIEDDPGYIEWALDTVGWFELDDEALEVWGNKEGYSCVDQGE